MSNEFEIFTSGLDYDEPFIELFSTVDMNGNRQGECMMTREYILRWTSEKLVEAESIEEAQEIAENCEDYGDIEDFEIVEVNDE